MMRFIIFGAVLWSFFTAPAHADGACTPSSAGLAFGPVSKAQATSAGSVVLTCTGSGIFNYTVRLGAGSSGSFAARTMTKGRYKITGNLYRDAARTQTWGDGTGGSSTVTGTVSMLQQRSVSVTLTVYGRLFAQVAPTAGSYSDTITVSVTTGLTTRTGAMPLSATVQPDCTIAATDLTFGAYTGNQLNGQSLISLSCTNQVPWSLGLSQGDYPGATTATRRMIGPGASMAYSLFRDTMRTLNWGNTAGVDSVSGTGTGTVERIPVYGRVPASQNLPAGNYHDTIVAVVTF